MTKCVMKQERW